MREGRLIAISDVHLDAWREETFASKRQAFRDFLDWVRDGSGCEHFAVVGDLLDVPQIDHSPILPRFRDLFTHLFGLTRAGIMVHWIVGNHDVGLMGLDVAMTHPPVQVAYPGVCLRSGGRNVWLEHGHDLDAWLWAFVQYRAVHVEAVAPALAMAHFGPGGGATALPIPAASFVHDTLYAAIQWRAMQTGFTADEQRLGIQVLSQQLGDEFADVSEDGRLPEGHAEILAELQRLGLTAEQVRDGAPLPEEALHLFMMVGRRYYSALPWRRAARSRLQELRQREGPRPSALIMGHIHAVDHYQWQSDDEALAYANCGSWTGDGGSFILVDEGRISTFQRRWDDPLPALG